MLMITDSFLLVHHTDNKKCPDPLLKTDKTGCITVE